METIMIWFNILQNIFRRRKKRIKVEMSVSKWWHNLYFFDEWTRWRTFRYRSCVEHNFPNKITIDVPLNHLICGETKFEHFWQDRLFNYTHTSTRDGINFPNFSVILQSMSPKDRIWKPKRICAQCERRQIDIRRSLKCDFRKTCFEARHMKRENMRIWTALYCTEGPGRDFQMSSVHQRHLKLFMTSKRVGEKIKIWRHHESMRGWSGNTDTTTLIDNAHFV